MNKEANWPRKRPFFAYKTARQRRKGKRSDAGDPQIVEEVSAEVLSLLTRLMQAIYRAKELESVLESLARSMLR